MKLLTRYTRVNLFVMVGVFLLSAAAYYGLVNYILIGEMDADLLGIQARIEQYASRYHTLPTGLPLDEEQLTYKAMEKALEKRRFTLIQGWSQRENKMHNFRQLVFPLRLNGRQYSVTIAKPLEGLHHLTRIVLIVSLSTILLTILCSLLINRIILRRLWQPFYDAMNAMRNFKLGRNQPLQFSPTRIDEFAFMNDNLGKALQKAEQDYLLLKEFTENASHELQTPLSIIRSKLDLLIQEEALSQRQSEIVKSAYTAIKKLSRLNQSLLLLTKIENREFNNTRPVDLKEKLTEKIGQFRELWQHRAIRIEDRLQEASIQASPELIDILLNNLLSNASNHNIHSGSIEIELSPGRLAISNTGTAAALDPQRVFMRFYKGEQHTGNNGLGLSIIKQICEVSSIEPGYLQTQGKHVFVLTWPRSVYPQSLK